MLRYLSSRDILEMACLGLVAASSQLASFKASDRGLRRGKYWEYADFCLLLATWHLERMAVMKLPINSISGTTQTLRKTFPLRRTKLRFIRARMKMRQMRPLIIPSQTLRLRSAMLSSMRKRSMSVDMSLILHLRGQRKRRKRSSGSWTGGCVYGLYVKVILFCLEICSLQRIVRDVLWTSG